MSRARLWIARSLVAALLAAPSLALGQDIYIESKTHTDQVKVLGRTAPARDGVNRTWIGDDKIAILDDAGSSIILRADRGKMYLLFPKDRTYYESSLPFELPPEVAQMMAAMEPQVTVAPTGETRVVNGFKTRLTRVQIQMMGQTIDMDYWTSTDLGIPMAKIREFTQAMVVGNPMMGELGKKLAAVEGYPVRVDSRVTAMGTTFGSWQEVQKVVRKPAPRGTYDVPRGYKKTESFKMGQG